MKNNSKIEYIDVDYTDQEQINRLNEEIAKGKVLKSTDAISHYMHFLKTDNDSHLQHKYILPINFDSFKEDLFAILKDYSNDATINTKTDIENFLRNRLLNYFRTQQVDLYNLLMQGKKMYDEVEEIRQLYIVLSYNVLINKNYNKVISYQDLENMSLDDLTYSLIDMLYYIVDENDNYLYRLDKDNSLDFTINIEETRKELLKKIEDNKVEQTVIKDSIVYNPTGILSEYSVSDLFVFEKWKMNNLKNYCKLVNQIILQFSKVKLSHSFSFGGNNSKRWLEYDGDTNKKEIFDVLVPCEIVAKRIDKFIEDIVGYCPVVWGYDIEKYWYNIFFNPSGRFKINIYNFELSDGFANYIYLQEPDLYNLFKNGDIDFLVQKIKNDIKSMEYYTIVQESMPSYYKFEHPNACLLYASQFNEGFINDPKIVFSSLPDDSLSNYFGYISLYNENTLVRSNGIAWQVLTVFDSTLSSNKLLLRDKQTMLTNNEFYNIEYEKDVKIYKTVDGYSYGYDDISYVDYGEYYGYGSVMNYIKNIPSPMSAISNIAVGGNFEDIVNKDDKTVYISKSIAKPIKFSVDVVPYNYKMGQMLLSDIGHIEDIRLTETEWDYSRREYLSNVEETEPYDYNYDVLKKKKSIVKKYVFSKNTKYIDIEIDTENIKKREDITDPTKYIEDFHGYVTVITKIDRPVSLRSIKLTEYQYIAYRYEFDNKKYEFVSQKEMDRFASTITGFGTAYTRYKNALKDVYIITRIPNIKIIAA